MSKKMIFVPYVKKGETTPIVFDDFTDNTEEFQSYWCCMCSSCCEKYKSVLGDRMDDAGQGTCSVEGCEHEADYYIDFGMDEVIFTDNSPIPLGNIKDTIRPGTYFDYISIIWGYNNRIAGVRRYVGQYENKSIFIAAMDTVDDSSSMSEMTLDGIVDAVQSGLALVFFGACNNMRKSEYIIWRAETRQSIVEQHPDADEATVEQMLQDMEEKAKEIGFITREISEDSDRFKKNDRITSMLLP